MATAVAVMDESGLHANTDVLVVVEPSAELLLWVPRDLWCRGLGDRVNRAFALGGHGGLAAALSEHGLEIQHSLCLGRLASERALAGVSAEVPIAERLELLYPVDPRRPIEEGQVQISFEPPSEVLRGERVHQWIGARYGVDGTGTDLDRVERQGVLLRALLDQRFDFSPALELDEEVALSDPAGLEDLRRVGPDWTFAVFGDDAVPAEIDGKLVLVR